MQGRFQRSISSEVSSRIEGSNQLQINIQQPIARANTSQIPSSIQQNTKSQLSIHDKISMLNESIRTSEKNEKLFQENMLLRQKLHQTEQALQDAIIKCSLWDNFKLTIEGLNKDYLQLKSIQNNCSDGTLLKEFLSVLREKLEKVSISQRVEKSYSVESKKKDTEYYELYQKEKKQNFQYQQHIITLNNQLDMLEEQNQKLKQKLKTSSLQSSGVIASDGTLLTGSQKKIYEELTVAKEQNVYLLEHKNTLQEQLDAERVKLKEIVESLDQYESEIKRNQLELKKRNKELENEVEAMKEAEKTIKGELQQSISENTLLRAESHRLSTLLNSYRQTGSVPTFPSSQNILQSHQYLDLMSQYEILYQKYQKVKAQNQVLGEEKQKLGQEMQEIQHLSKQMEYNYEVKIDDLRKNYQGELETMMNNFNQKILSLSEERSQTLMSAERQKIQLTEKLEKLQRSTSSQDSDKGLLINKYEKAMMQHKQQITRCKKELQQNELIIEQLKQQVYDLTEQLEQTQQSRKDSNNLTEMQQKYKTKISMVQSSSLQLKQKNQQLTEQVQALREHIESITAELNQQDQTIEQYKSQLVKKDQVIARCRQEKEKGEDNKKYYGESQRFKLLEQEIQAIMKAKEQLRKALTQSEENNAVLNKNIADWQIKYTSLTNQQKIALIQYESLKSQILNLSQTQSQNLSLQTKINLLSQEITNLTSQLFSLKQQQFTHTQTTTTSHTQQPQSVQIMQTMDGLMVQALKQQIQTLLQENRTIQEENNRFRQEISESQQQVQEIQQYVKLISVENKKIPHYEQELLKERMRSEKLKQKLTQQKDKFMAIMEKNQQVYEQLVRKSQRNQLILNENIRIQKEETQKLQNLINKYYSSFIPVHEQNKDKIQDKIQV